MSFKEIEKSVILFSSFLNKPTKKIEGNSKYAEENPFVSVVPKVFKVSGIEIYEQEENAKITSSIIIIFYSQVKNSERDNAEYYGIYKYLHLSHFRPFIQVAVVAKDRNHA